MQRVRAGGHPQERPLQRGQGAGAGGPVEGSEEAAASEPFPEQREAEQPPGGGWSWCRGPGRGGVPAAVRRPPEERGQLGGCGGQRPVRGDIREPGDGPELLPPARDIQPAHGEPHPEDGHPLQVAHGTSPSTCFKRLLALTALINIITTISRMLLTPCPQVRGDLQLLPGRGHRQRLVPGDPAEGQQHRIQLQLETW